MPAFRYLVDDVDAAVAFYERLGFVLSERWGPPFAIVTRDDVSLWLSGPGTSARRSLEDGAEPRPGGWNRLVLPVEDLAATVAGLEAAGVRFRSRPVSGPGGQQALVDDPSGNPVELFEPRERTG
ncbi:MAG: VOC family protein [Chloroflexota bacterium]